MISVKPPSFLLLSIGLAAASVVAASGAVADDEPESYTLEEVQACSGDAMRLCRDALPSIHKIEACMEAKLSQLSKPCQAMFRPGRKR